MRSLETFYQRYFILKGMKNAIFFSKLESRWVFISHIDIKKALGQVKTMSLLSAIYISDG